MTDQRKRGPEGTVQARAFRILLTASLTASALAELLGVERETARRAMFYLEHRGVVQRHRIRARCTMYAAVGTREPRDLRGKRKGSRNHRGHHAHAWWLRMMQNKHGPSWRPPLVRDLSSTAAMLLKL